MTDSIAAEVKLDKLFKTWILVREEWGRGKISKKIKYTVYTDGSMMENTEVAGVVSRLSYRSSIFVKIFGIWKSCWLDTSLDLNLAKQARYPFRKIKRELYLKLQRTENSRWKNLPNCRVAQSTWPFYDIEKTRNCITISRDYYSRPITIYYMGNIKDILNKSVRKVEAMP